MATKVYGQSDDLIEIEGDELRGEVGYYGGDEDEGALLVMSDGTILGVKYGKPGNLGVWAISVVRKGDLFDRIDVCFDEDATPYSDVAHFRPGITGGWAAKTWEPIR